MTRLSGLSNQWLTWRHRAAAWSPLTVSIWVTLTTVVLFSPWPSLLPVLAVALAGIAWPHLTRRAWFWFALAAIRFVTLVPFEWATLDNHHYLLTYWLVALGCVQLSSDPQRTAALSGRLLIGLAFVAATLWKLATPDFASGEFFRFLLATDATPAPIGLWLPGADAELVNSNREAVYDVLVGGSGATTFQESSLAPTVAAVLAWWTLLIEAAVALVFLTPLGGRLRLVRHVALIAFIVTTYPVAPVMGFGWTLVALGLAVVRSGDARTLQAMLLASAVVFVATIPHLPAMALVFAGLLASLAYLYSAQRWILAIGAPVGGFGVGLTLDETHAALGVAAGFLVEALFARLRQRPIGTSIFAAGITGGAAGIAWLLPSATPLAWIAIVLAGGFAVRIAYQSLWPSKTTEFHPSQRDPQQNRSA